MACREAGVKTVAVTAGYLTDKARPAFFRNVDAANVDLKAFTESFYKSVTKSELGPVLDTLCYLRHETDVWFEITNLIIPGENDSEREIGRDWYVLSEWKLDAGGCCTGCGTKLAGVIEEKPGSWGQKRMPVDISAFA